MRIITHDDGRCLTLRLLGELDLAAAQEVMPGIEDAVEEYLPRRCVLDLSGLSFMDSSGIGVLLNRYMQLKAGNTGFYGACPQVMRVLKDAGILGLMHQYESKEDAIYSREV